MITFQNLERWQNWFKTNSKEGISYELHGGKDMENWVIKTLENLRKGDKKSEDLRDSQPDNDFNPEIANVNGKVNQSYSKQLGPSKVNEEINKIKKLINYGS
jgi:hypothetical protein